MEFKPLTSSTITAVGYDAETRTLGVQFKTGGTYHYEDVPEEVYSAFVVADSVETYFQRYIRDGYKRVKAEDS